MPCAGEEVRKWDPFLGVEQGTVQPFWEQWGALGGIKVSMHPLVQQSLSTSSLRESPAQVLKGQGQGWSLQWCLWQRGAGGTWVSITKE